MSFNSHLATEKKWLWGNRGAGASAISATRQEMRSTAHHCQERSGVQSLVQR